MFTHFCNVFNDNNLKFISKWFEERPEMSSLALGADCTSDREALVEERLDDPDSDVTVRACDKDLPICNSGHRGMLCVCVL